MNTKQVTGETMKLIRAHHDSKGLITMYKAPSTKSVRGYYNVETLDASGQTVESRSFRNIRRKLDADRFFEYAKRMS